MERGLPFIQCVRSFAELFYCHICLPETSSLFPCRNVCKNVISGCTIFLHVIGEEMIEPLRALCQLYNDKWSCMESANYLANTEQ